eukprot:55006_1
MFTLSFVLLLLVLGVSSSSRISSSSGSNLRCYSGSNEEVTYKDLSECKSYHNACMIRWNNDEKYWVRECTTIEPDQELGCSSFTDSNGLKLSTCYCSQTNCNGNDIINAQNKHSQDIPKLVEREGSSNTIHCYVNRKKEVTSKDIVECSPASNGCLYYNKQSETIERACTKIDKHEILGCQEIDGATVCYCDTNNCNQYDDEEEDEDKEKGKQTDNKNDDEKEKEDDEEDKNEDGSAFKCYLSHSKEVGSSDVIECGSGSNGCLYYTNNQNSFWERKCVTLKKDDIDRLKGCHQRDDGTKICYCTQMNCNGNDYNKDNDDKDDDDDDDKSKDENQEKEKEKKK